MRFILLLLSLIFLLSACQEPAEEYPENNPGYVPPKVKNQGCEIAYTLHMPDSSDFPCPTKNDTTLLYIHGWNLSQSYWDSTLTYLGIPYPTVTVDLPGFGSSGKDRDNWTIEDYAQDIQILIKRLNLNKVILIGHSMAGDIILETALNSPQVIALIGVDNFKDVQVYIPLQQINGMNAFVQSLRDNYEETVRSSTPQLLFHPSTSEYIQALIINQYISGNNHSVSIETLQALFDYAPKEAKQLAKLKQPLYLINAESPPTDTTALQALGIQYQLLSIPESGHFPMIEKPKVFVNRLETVLSSIAKP